MFSAAHVVEGAVRILAADGMSCTAEFFVSESEPVFAGHYPGFAIFPGVCILEVVFQAAEQAFPEEGLVMAVVESTRFLRPVFPRDRLLVELTWTASDDGWVARAIVSCVGEVAVRARVRYQKRTAEGHGGA